MAIMPPLKTTVMAIMPPLKTTVPAKALEETRAQFARRLKAVIKDENETCAVENLCNCLGQRVQDSVDAEGDRLPK